MNKCIDYIDVCTWHKIFQWEFELNIAKWNTLDNEIRKILLNKWEVVKFLNDDGTELNSEMDTIPNDRGGIYIFLAKPEIVPVAHQYIMYIGRARKQKEFNLRKRCKTYFKDTRPEIARLREILGESLYIMYLPLDDDQVIEEVERELLRVIIPPCNSKIPDKNVIVKAGVPAF